jgi:hypothetical protein
MTNFQVSLDAQYTLVWLHMDLLGKLRNHPWAANHNCKRILVIIKKQVHLLAHYSSHTLTNACSIKILNNASLQRESLLSHMFLQVCRWSTVTRYFHFPSYFFQCVYNWQALSFFILTQPEVKFRFLKLFPTMSVKSS